MKHLNSDEPVASDGLMRVPMKLWLRATARRMGIGATGVFMRIKRGHLPAPATERLNARKVFVLLPAAAAVEFGAAALAALPAATPSKPGARRTPKDLRCLCGEPASAVRFNMPVCARCLSIEERLDADFHRHKPTDPLAKYGHIYSMVAA